MGTAQEFDVIVVGAGSAGCVVAARLSEDPARRVLLVEAGPLYTDDWPPALLDVGVIPARHAETWQYTTKLAANHLGYVSRGRLVGGSGAINGAAFVRATPADVDGWGVPGISAAQLLPAFRRSESDADFRGPLHGDSGPMPVRRTRGHLHPISAAFATACINAGFPEEPDKNGAGDPGIGPLPLNLRDGVRVNAALAYLLPALGRPTLTVRAGITVSRVLIENGRASGVELADGAMVRASEVVLCAGAVASAQLLLVSGVGPANDLRALGLAVHADLPVGQGFSDHPDVAVPYTPTEPVPRPPGTPGLEVVLNTGIIELRPYTASFAELIDGGRMLQPCVGVALMQPESRGMLTLRSSDPAVPPQLAHHYLETEHDRTALRDGVHLARALLGLPDSDDAQVDRWIAVNLGTSMHTVGTCALGRVVDERSQVMGVDGLRVVDASAIPVVPSRGPHATVIALAEHAVS